MRWTTELAITAGRIDLLIERAEKARSIASRRFALDALARGLLLADPGAVHAAAREAALALGVDPSTVQATEIPAQPHAVCVPLVGDAVGFVRQVHVVFDPVGLREGDTFLRPQARRSIARSIAAAARRAPPPSDPGLHRLCPARPAALAGTHVDGPSLAAATYVSAISLWTGRPTRPRAVVTGALHGDAVISVGAVEAKTRAAVAYGADTLVVPAADEAIAREAARAAGAHTLTVRGVASTEALLEATLAPSRVRAPRPEKLVEQAHALFRTGWRGYRWPSIRDSLSRLSGTLPEPRIDLRVDVLCRWAAAQRHVGDPVGCLRLLEEAQALVDSERGQQCTPDDKLVYLLQQTAMTEKQLCRFEPATLAAQRGAQIARSARLRGMLIKALSVVGLVAMAAGEVERAVEAFLEALSVELSFTPENTARTRAYLIGAYGAAGDLDAAALHFRMAMEELERGDPELRGGAESWVRTSFAGALVDLDRPAQAAEVLDADCVRRSIEEEALPGIFARRWLGLARAAIGEPAQGYEILAASPMVYGRAMEPHLRFLAHLNVLYEASARAARGDWNTDIAGRALRAVEQIPRYGWVPGFLDASLGAVTAALTSSEPPPQGALDDLLRRCARLG